MSSSPLRAAVRARMPAGLDDLAALVAIPSVHDPAVQSLDDCHRVAEAVRVAFGDLGLEARLATTADGSQAVIATHPAPAGAPTVLLYAHHDVQPAGDLAAWTSDPWTLTPRDGRLYGRGAADCKGGIVTHLVALRALLDVHGAFPVGLVVVVEGSEEQGTDGLEQYVSSHAADFRHVDTAVVMDAGNAAVGVPALVTTLRGTAFVELRVRALGGTVHSGMFGGAAPDAIAVLVALLATLRDEVGDTTVDGLDASQTWDGLPYDADRFAADAGLLDGAVPIGSADPASQVWARPALTVVGIDAPAVAGSSPSVQATAGAALNLRVPPGVDPAAAGELLVAHLLRRAPAGVEVTARVTGVGAGFRAEGGPSSAAFRAALSEAYDGAPVGSLGGGGSIPLCATLERAIPDVEVILAGVSEPAANVHGPDESVDPSEIEHMALAEALFLTSLTTP
ncbi:M20/M25/M40 family metallo-hydrolase [Curtobacterium sp. YR515]|uniref:M20/M25/M40 family metallo-hydrolase n=1 Tax=Curtobacterium sp. YR515 TaxID=1855316 RepID=UPI0008F1180C|nr:M20/M25/M40 family metallo-hydrolase [Curtobacterium sp. YR515]SFF45204.1 Acetylornithine deacetylase/Succinyl-diaminopimelate desuccinylase [Curtobacterium sp. YR515]